MRHDTTALKERVDVLSLVERDTPLRRVAAKEYAGPCPKCGGTDRFHVTPVWWFCRQCHEQRGDVIEYLQWRDDLSFSEACAALEDSGSALGTIPGANTAQRRPKVTPTPKGEPPSEAWQDRARSLVAYAEAQLWENEEALAYLRGRGLRDETIRAAHLGYVPRTMHDGGARWGLEDPRIEIAHGWTIPCEVDSAIWYVKIRRPGEHARGKYANVRGGPTGGVIYGLDDARDRWDVVLCEGELNALVLRQEIAGVCGVVSVGAAGNTPGDWTLPVLARVSRWWAVFDPDDAGQKGSARLGSLSARVRPLAWPWAERGDKYDLNDAHRDGENLAAWLVPQVGPTELSKRQVWIEHWLTQLKDPAFEARIDDTDPGLRAWLALWEDRLVVRQGERREPSATASGDDEEEQLA